MSEEWPPWRLAILLEMHKAGFTMNAIGKRLGMTGSGVGGKLDRMGVTRDRDAPITGLASDRLFAAVVGESRFDELRFK